MKLKITIIGLKVHDVGYRPFLIALADEFELDGFGARNTEVEGKQAVRVKAEGEEECIREFEEAVKTRRPEGAIVSSVRSEPFEGRVPSIERTAITNMNLQLAKGITALNKILEKEDETVGILKEVKKDTSSMLDKQDETIEAVRDLKRDNERFIRIEKDIKTIKSKIGAR